MKRMYREYVLAGNRDITPSIIKSILVRPSGMWVGLFEIRFFDLDVKLKGAHELHRIMTISSVLSWGRFYHVP